MNLLGYFVLVAAVVSVAVAQKSSYNLQSETISFIKKCSRENEDARVYHNATVLLENSFIIATNRMSKSEEIILRGISRAKRLLSKNPQLAKKVVQRAFENSHGPLFSYGISSGQAIGEALGISNYGSYEGLMVASKSIEIGGFSALNSANVAQNLLYGGIDVGGKAAIALLEAGQLAVEAGYTGGFYNIKDSIQNADKALRDAKIKPIRAQYKHKNCVQPTNDPQISEEINEIIEAANDAFERGVNAEIAHLLKGSLICALEDFAKILDKGVRAVEHIKTIADSEPLAVEILYIRVDRDFIEEVKHLFVKIYVGLGNVAIQSGSQSSNEIAAAILVLINGEVNIVLGVKSALDMINIATKYGGDAHMLALNSSLKFGTYTKIVFAQTLAKIAKLVFSAL